MHHLIAVPGFSSRSSIHVVKQFPHRDEAAMSDTELKAGWSNSDAVKDAPEDVTPDVEPPEEQKPGFSNSKAVKADEPAAEPTEQPVADGSAEPEKKPVAKKTAAKKTAAKKG